ncbi:hypothetical protein [Marinobacterium aestuariivivens]|uniref:hypothetical protein n=1 Tax=Marinobacterium aestuariivivens TaxID=1698799 RepID=UPI0036D2BC06
MTVERREDVTFDGLARIRQQHIRRALDVHPHAIAAMVEAGPVTDDTLALLPKRRINDDAFDRFQKADAGRVGTACRYRQSLQQSIGEQQ